MTKKTPSNQKPQTTPSPKNTNVIKRGAFDSTTRFKESKTQNSANVVTSTMAPQKPGKGGK